ncbi:MAG: L-fucose:H+ symporter permease [Niallia nealsonii]|uniref:L-fucose:H+ symporter permease n=1 Tax=Niallia alba TaxID=2729105 RepID=UPI002901F0EC|nr:L-fucose:H+ symporter permease [Niallia nealsonii]MED3793680.1 L-fucose:H+ symporter permease [Niallia alba]
MKKGKILQTSEGYLNKMPIFQFILVSVLFALWGAASALNDILITQFKTVFSLSDFATAFVQSAFYGGYFLLALPASLLIKKTSYQVAIICGLFFYILGCYLFFPASSMATYGMFLFAIFILALGLSFLETSANTFSSMLGPKDSATLRLNISQTFNPIGCIVGIVLGKYLVFNDGASLEEQMAGMSASEVQAFGLEMLQNTLAPYKYILVVLIVMLVLFIVVKFPKCKTQATVPNVKDKSAGFKETLKVLSKNTRFKKGVLAQFFYMGVQVGVWSFTIRLALDMHSELNERVASNYMIISYVAFFVGRFLANFLIARYSSTRVLFIYSTIGSVVLAYASIVPNVTAIYAAVFVSVLFGPCWPTIFAHTLEVVEDKRHVEMAGAIIVMAIVGGAIIPAVQGLVSDLLGSMQWSFMIPTICFAYVAYYFYKESKFEKTEREEPILSA